MPKLIAPRQIGLGIDRPPSALRDVRKAVRSGVVGPPQDPRRRPPSLAGLATGSSRARGEGYGAERRPPEAAALCHRCRR